MSLWRKATAIDAYLSLFHIHMRIALSEGTSNVSSGDRFEQVFAEWTGHQAGIPAGDAHGACRKGIDERQARIVHLIHRHGRLLKRKDELDELVLHLQREMAHLWLILLEDGIQSATGRAE